MTQIATHRFRIGAFDCLVAKDGSTSPSRLSSIMADPPEGLAETPLTLLAGLLVVDTPGARVLIDGGNGPHRGGRTHAAEAALAAEGISPESVSVVLITHGDFDHVGGLVDKAGRLVYPNARYVLHRELWDFWHNAEAIGAYDLTIQRLLHKILGPLLPAVDARGTIIDNEQRVVGDPEALDGITAIPALGHRAGHMLYLIESEDTKLLHIGDAAVHPLFLEYPDRINIRHDTNPEAARDSRRMIAARAATTGARILGTHFELPGIGTLSQIGEDRYRWVSVGEP